ncbi:hypothetical protein Goshw_007915 [Gossypium schwendimanii]|uniref:Uncharacterized protein n=1 Tax=Gossypium schwendimanii TaxID=34291 RepID=A0A7J9M3K8_GOSSC|nr:hypothetical protein [Gossypium schwendimanii]
MVVDLDSQPKVSWKQILLGKGVSDQAEGSRSTEVDCTEDFEFLEVLKGLDNLELKDDARDKMISGDAVANLKGNEKMVVQNFGKVKALTKGGGPRDDATGLISARLKLAKNPHENSVEINYGPNSEGMVVVLDGYVLDLGKHSMVIFKETPNPNKGEVLKDRGDDEVGKEVPTPKVRGSSDKGGTSRSGRKLNQTIRNCRDSFKLAGTVHVPLSDFISSLVELINTHLDIENRKGSDVSKRM